MSSKWVYAKFTDSVHRLVHWLLHALAAVYSVLANPPLLFFSFVIFLFLHSNHSNCDVALFLMSSCS